MSEKKWYNNVFVIILAILLFWPISLILLVLHPKVKESGMKIMSCILVAVFLLLFSLVLFFPSRSIESIHIEVANPQTVYDLNTEISVNISVTPENADTDSLEYYVEGESMTFSEVGVYTGSEEGTFKIGVKSGDIASNMITLPIVNLSTNQESGLAAEKSEEEPLAAEETRRDEEPIEESEEEYNEEWARRTAEVAENNAEIKEQYTTYVLNTSTLKIHLPSCGDVDRIDSENYATSSLSREDLEFQGYTVCHHCFDD